MTLAEKKNEELKGMRVRILDGRWRGARGTIDMVIDGLVTMTLQNTQSLTLPVDMVILKADKETLEHKYAMIKGFGLPGRWSVKELSRQIMHL